MSDRRSPCLFCGYSFKPCPCNRDRKQQRWTQQEKATPKEASQMQIDEQRPQRVNRSWMDSKRQSVSQRQDTLKRSRFEPLQLPPSAYNMLPTSFDQSWVPQTLLPSYDDIPIFEMPPHLVPAPLSSFPVRFGGSSSGPRHPAPVLDPFRLTRSLNQAESGPSRSRTNSVPFRQPAPSQAPIGSTRIPTLASLLGKRRPSPVLVPHGSTRMSTPARSGQFQSKPVYVPVQLRSTVPKKGPFVSTFSSGQRPPASSSGLDPTNQPRPTPLLDSVFPGLFDGSTLCQNLIAPDFDRLYASQSEMHGLLEALARNADPSSSAQSGEQIAQLSEVVSPTSDEEVQSAVWEDAD